MNKVNICVRLCVGGGGGKKGRKEEVFFIVICCVCYSQCYKNIMRSLTEIKVIMKVFILIIYRIL